MRGYPRNRIAARPAGDIVNAKTTNSRGYTISYEDVGSGVTVVLLPGWTMSAADWRDAGYLDALAGHRILNVDPLGNGLSDKPHDPDAYRWPEVAADVVAVLDAAGVDRAVVWGYSRGASLAAVVAAEFPDRVAAVIIDADGDQSSDIPAGSPVDPIDLAMFNGNFGPLWNQYSFSDEDRRYDAEVNDPRALGAMEVGLARWGRRHATSGIVAPALVLHGGNDGPDRGPSRTAAALGVEVRVMPELDHLETFTRLDLVMPIVRGFLGPLGL